MTERLPPLQSQSLTPSQTVATLGPKDEGVFFRIGLDKAHLPIEEEPYTIKCICGFNDDDGNTIYCDQCDTWQHIECYYPHNVDEALREDFAHFCADCRPRPLDRPRARERQALRQTRINNTEAPERKTAKRPPSKSHKKKSKPSDLALNGHSGSDANTKHPSEFAPLQQHKKSKSTHRPSQSTSFSHAKRSPSYGLKNGNVNGHPPSPVTTPPDFPYEAEIHNYSDGFLNLYKNDTDIAVVQTNSFASLGISNVLSSWLRDHDKLRRETGCDYNDVFQSLPPNFHSVKASPQVQSKKAAIGSDMTVRWQYLTTLETTDKDVPLIEVNGQIGIQKEYCEDPDNRWQELSSPLPFVFFHPLLPLYIDTRREGSLARYVRRSCKPNAVLDTYLLDGSEYHFWLVSDRRLSAHEQITIAWEFNLQKDIKRRWLQLLGLSEFTEIQPEFDEKETQTYQNIASWVYTILSEYGGCACDLGPDCAFARFHRNYISRPHTREKKPKKARKVKSTISPTGTGQATNSRAASEGRGDDGADNDSGSSRSKPPSRDMTPAPRQGSFDTLGVLTELTDREKRKVQMVEDSFRRMEQQQQPPRKKKRISDGTSSSAPTTKPKLKNSTSHAPNLPNGVSERRYVDAGTSRSLSGSPSSVVSLHTTNLFNPQGQRSSVPIPSRDVSQSPRAEYRDACVQTDPVNGEWFSSPCQAPKPRRRVVSLSKRLLDSRHRLRTDERERRKSVAASPTSVTSALVKMDLESPTTESAAIAASPDAEMESTLPALPKDSSIDSAMVDAPSVSPADVEKPSVNIPVPSLSVKAKSPELRVQLPPVPAFSDPSPTGNVTTPQSASILHSPFSANNLHSPFAPSAVNGTTVYPSPIKKKLSLSDYTKSRMNKAAATKPVMNLLKPPKTISEDTRSPTVVDTIMGDSPAVEKGVDS